MIRKTNEEKELLKAAKIAFKKAKKDPQFHDPLLHPPEKLEKRIRNGCIMNGILEGEYPLNDDHPIYAGYSYVIDDNGGQVVNANFSGSVKMYKKILQNNGYQATTIRTCNLRLRNLL